MHYPDPLLEGKAALIKGHKYFLTFHCNAFEDFKKFSPILKYCLPSLRIMHSTTSLIALLVKILPLPLQRLTGFIHSPMGRSFRLSKTYESPFREQEAHSTVRHVYTDKRAQTELSISFL